MLGCALAACPYPAVIDTVIGRIFKSLWRGLDTMKIMNMMLSPMPAVQAMRKQSGSPAKRALITRVLFILTRCSRLVVTGKP